MKLSDKFSVFRSIMKLDEMPEQQARFAQSSWLAGAQAAFQLLASFSDLEHDESIRQWHGVQQEILEAIGAKAKPVTPDEPLVVVPENKVVLM